MLCQHLCRAAANVSLQTILLGVGGAIYSPCSLEPLKRLCVDPQKVTKLALKLHAHLLQYAYKYQTHSRELLQQIIIKTRKRVLLVIPLIPTEIFCFLCWWMSRTVLRP